MVVATDVGGAKGARNGATRLRCDLAIVDKRRTGNDDSAEAMTLIGDVQDRDCLIIDDEILTGGTVASSLELLRRSGARSVYVGCVHGLFAGAAFELLDTTDISELVFTDSVPLAADAFKQVPTKVLSIAPLFGDAIHRIHTGGSVGELFRHELPRMARRASDRAGLPSGSPARRCPPALPGRAPAGGPPSRASLSNLLAVAVLFFDSESMTPSTNNR